MKSAAGMTSIAYSISRLRTRWSSGGGEIEDWLSVRMQADAAKADIHGAETWGSRQRWNVGIKAENAESGCLRHMRLQ
jgi:hypothetical protein